MNKIRLGVPSASVSLHGEAFQFYKQRRDEWLMNDHYSNPGPIQFRGKTAFFPFKSLRVRGAAYSEDLRQIELLAEEIKHMCQFGSHQDAVKIAASSLRNLMNTLQYFQKNVQ